MLSLEYQIQEASSSSPVWDIIKESLADKGNRYLMLFYDSEVTKHLLLMHLKE
jgi:hypothetical protein